MYVKDIYFTIIGGCDYDAGPYNLQLRAGYTRFSFDVGIIDDDIYEKEPESFNLVIDMTSPNRVERCNPFRTTVTIIDNDQRKIIYIL